LLPCNVGPLAHLRLSGRTRPATCVSCGRTVLREFTCVLRPFRARCEFTSASRARGSPALAPTRQRALDLLASPACPSERSPDSRPLPRAVRSPTWDQARPPAQVCRVVVKNSMHTACGQGVRTSPRSYEPHRCPDAAWLNNRDLIKKRSAADQVGGTAPRIMQDVRSPWTYLPPQPKHLTVISETGLEPLGRWTSPGQRRPRRDRTFREAR